MTLSSIASSDIMPLTFGQKARLIVDCLPALFFVLALVFCLTFFDDIYGAPPPLVLLLFLGFVTLWMGYQALQRTRDLASGVALVVEDVLARSWAARGTGRGFFGKFERLGTLSMIPKAHFGSQNGRRYRVIYSPASKLVWALEPLDQGGFEF